MKKYDDQITLKLAAPLRAVLEDAAAEDGRPLSSQIRKVLTDWSTAHVVSRASADAGAR
jgi:hypothetical protein